MFTGSSSAIELKEWSYRLQLHFEQYDVTDPHKRLVTAKQHTEGSAAAYIRTTDLQAGGNGFSNLQDLETRLATRYDPQHDRLTAELEIATILQEDRESMQAYADRFQGLALKSTYTEQQLCQLFSKGLRSFRIRNDLMDLMKAGNLEVLVNKAVYMSQSSAPFESAQSKDRKRTAKPTGETEETHKHKKPHLQQDSHDGYQRGHKKDHRGKWRKPGGRGDRFGGGRDGGRTGGRTGGRGNQAGRGDRPWPKHSRPCRHCGGEHFDYHCPQKMTGQINALHQQIADLTAAVSGNRERTPSQPPRVNFLQQNQQPQSSSQRRSAFDRLHFEQ